MDALLGAAVALTAVALVLAGFAFGYLIATADAD